MRKSLLVIALMLIAGITMTTKSAQAQCPTGYDEVTVTMQVYGCTYDVKFCVKCATGPVPASISIIGLMPRPGCLVTLPFLDVYQEVKNEAMTWQFIQANLCFENQPMPCANGSETVTYDTWLCWQVERIYYFGEETDYYGACDYGAKCTETYEFCTEADGTTVRRTLVSAVSSGTPSCYLQSWQITMPVNVGDVSDCYIINTACTP